MKNQLKYGVVVLWLLAFGCGGGAGSNQAQSIGYKSNYTDPTPSSASVPVVRLNSTLSTDTIAVFDVVGNAPSIQVRGCVLNLAMDTAKVAFVDVPGGNEGAQLGKVSTAGFAGTYGRAVAKLNAQGTYLMGTAVRAPGEAQSAQGTLLRFAVQLQGAPVAGVIRATVQDGSGLLDERGRLIQGTAPAIGRLEIVKAS